MTAAALSLLTAMPLVIIWRMPAGQCIAPVSINPLNLADQAAAMPLVADNAQSQRRRPSRPTGLMMLRPKGGQRSLRNISAEVAQRCHRARA